MITYWNRAVHSLEAPPDELVWKLDEAVRSDRAAEQQKVRRAVAAFVLFVLCVILFFTAAGRKGKFKKRDRIFLYMSVVVGVCGAASVVSAVRASRRDVEQEKLTAARGLLKALAADTPKGAAAKLTLDLRSYDSLKPAAKEGWMFSSRSKTYVQPWLSLEGELADGNKYRLGVVEKVRLKEKPKRKWTKQRESTRSQVRVALRLRPEYGGADALVPKLKSVAGPDPMTAVGVAGKERLLTAVLALPVVRRANSRGGGLIGGQPHPTAEHLIKALMWTYSALGRKG